MTAPVVADPDLGVDALSSHLSPSRASNWMQCPALYYFSSVLRLPSPATEATTKGTLVHAACERVFDFPRGQRTPEAIVPYVRSTWAEIAEEPDYEAIRSKGDEHVESILSAAEDLVHRWFQVEDPNRFDPVGVELDMRITVAGVSLRGIIDRLDRVEHPGRDARWIVSDYKTGKVPKPNDRFLSEKFFAMRTYALMLRELLEVTPTQLRLVYVAGGSPDSVRSIPCDDQTLARQEAQLKAVWSGIRGAAKKGEWPTKRQPLCQWCDHMDICPAWNPALAGTPISVEVAAARGRAAA